mmetsp:Transcript_25922/g.76825  ORF Transcript_25922/g.76825 Transcript_25922/m.76825 type:complete len:211 (-) Transcript_25922:1240-1872(-)
MHAGCSHATTRRRNGSAAARHAQHVQPGDGAGAAAERSSCQAAQQGRYVGGGAAPADHINQPAPNLNRWRTRSSSRPQMLNVALHRHRLFHGPQLGDGGRRQHGHLRPHQPPNRPQIAPPQQHTHHGRPALFAHEHRRRRQRALVPAAGAVHATQQHVGSVTVHGRRRRHAAELQRGDGCGALVHVDGRTADGEVPVPRPHRVQRAVLHQ